MNARISQTEAFEKAKRSHRIAADALKSLSDEDISAHEMDRRWSEFVIQWENAMKFCIMATDSGTSKKIADQIRQDRSSEPSLQYLFQARNSEHHGGNILLTNESSMEIKPPGYALPFFTFTGDESAQIVFKNNFYNDGGSLKLLPNLSGTFYRGKFSGEVENSRIVEMRGPSFTLIPVSNRGETYAVPMQDIPENDRPYQVAKFGLKYLTEKISQIASVFE